MHNFFLSLTRWLAEKLISHMWYPCELTHYSYWYCSHYILLLLTSKIFFSTPLRTGYLSLTTFYWNTQILLKHLKNIFLIYFQSLVLTLALAACAHARLYTHAAHAAHDLQAAATYGQDWHHAQENRRHGFEHISEDEHVDYYVSYTIKPFNF